MTAHSKAHLLVKLYHSLMDIRALNLNPKVAEICDQCVADILNSSGEIMKELEEEFKGGQNG